MRNAYDLIYIETAGDTVEALRCWYHQDDLITETSRTFSGQVFDFCRKNKLKTLAISSVGEKKHVNFDEFSAFSKPKIVLNGSLGYHISQLLHGIRIIASVIYNRPKYLLIANGSTYLAVLSPLKLFKIKIIPVFHNTFWAKGYPPKGKIKRALLKLDAWFLKHIASAAMCCSPEIQKQIEEITDHKSCPVHQFKAQFYRKDFESPLPPPALEKKPFVVVFAGRIEQNKGVFDILKMATELINEQVIFHICGGGPDLKNLTNKCESNNLNTVVKIHGRLKRPELLAIYAQGHAVIIPTTSEFCEGLPMVAIEAVLLGRPVITSSLSNALDVLGQAIAEAKPENIRSYIDTIRQLASNKHLYQQKQLACFQLREQFLDNQHGLTNALQQII